MGDWLVDFEKEDLEEPALPDFKFAPLTINISSASNNILNMGDLPIDVKNKLEKLGYENEYSVYFKNGIPF
jgi:hypothetical protein